MPPKKTPRCKTGFFGVRAEPSDNFGVKFTHVGRRFWLGTYSTTDIVVRAYDVAAWRAGRPKKDLNFSEVESRTNAEMLMPGWGTFVWRK
ncbi:hypothetical protein ZWY2020_034320 [Hordeum vulgare]|nr:hypothetical protein ZWY2020_034320 [Hordeum vulgare]